MIGDAALIDDRSLLTHYARTRDAQAFNELAKRYAGLVYGTCLRVTQNPQDAEDVSQECFLEMARRAGSINSSLGGWLHKVARTRSINAIRSEVSRRKREQKAFEETDDSPSTWAEIAPYVDEAVDQLPDKLRLAVILHFFHGFDQSEVARHLEVNQSTISRQLDKAVGLLRESLKGAGVVVPVALLGVLLAGNSATAAPAALTASLGKMALAGVGGGSGASLSGILVPAKQFLTTLPAKLATGAIVLGVVGTVGYMVTTNASPVAPTAPPPVQTPEAQPTAPVAAVPPPAAQATVTPMSTYRSDPFVQSAYTPPAASSNVKQPIADLPIARIGGAPAVAGPAVAAPSPAQPARRMAGLVHNGGGIAAIVETNGRTEVVAPGEMLSDKLATVDRIEPDRVVLKTVGDAPEYITVGLAPGIKPEPVASAPAVAGTAPGVEPPPAVAPAAPVAVAAPGAFAVRRGPAVGMVGARRPMMGVAVRR